MTGKTLEDINRETQGFSCSYDTDFDAAEYMGGVEHIRDAYNAIISEHPLDYRYLSCLVVTLKRRKWLHLSNKDTDLGMFYDYLWRGAVAYATGMLSGEELGYFYRMTEST